VVERIIPDWIHQGTISLRTYPVWIETPIEGRAQVFRAQSWDYDRRVFYKTHDSDMEQMISEVQRIDSHIHSGAEYQKDTEDVESMDIIFTPCAIWECTHQELKYFNAGLLLPLGRKYASSLKRGMCVPDLRIVDVKMRKDNIQKIAGYIMESEYAGKDEHNTWKQFFLPYNKGIVEENIYQGIIADVQHGKRPVVKIKKGFTKTDELHLQNMRILEEIASDEKARFWWNFDNSKRNWIW